MDRAENNIISKELLLVVTIPLLAVLLYGITARVFLSQQDSSTSIVEAGEI
jgi:hypothetical protein